VRVGAGLSSPGRALLVFSAILAAFLGVTVLGIVYHERDMLRNARREAQQELELLSTLLREPLLENDYASVEAFMTLWGEEQEDVVALRAVAPDGSVLAGYERQEPSDYVVRLEKEVEVDGGQIVTLEAVKDFTPIRRSLYRLGVALIAGAVAMTALLGFALWYALKRFAISPLEEEISRREEAEEELRRTRDVLERRVAERTEELSHEKAMAQRYLEVAGVIFVVIGADRRVRLINRKGCEVLGYGEEEVVGENWFEKFLPERIRDDVGQVFDMIMAGEVDPVHYFENPVLTKSGEERVIAWLNALIYDEEGKPEAALSSGEDITRRREAEEMLAYSESYLRSVIEAEPECVKLVAPDGTLVRINPAGVAMVEAREESELLGASVFQMLAPEHRESFASFLQSVCAGNPGTLAFDIIGLKGARRSLESHAVPFRDDRRGQTLMLAVTRDVTERRRLEESLHQARKMEALGTLTGGIAHDFNNILSAIIGFGETLEMDLAPGDPKRPYLQQMLAAAEKGANLTHSLMAFGRKLVIKPMPVKLNSLVEGVKDIVANLVGDGVGLDVTLAEPSLTVMADASHIEQAIINLATNARDAMPYGGTLSISASEAVIDADFIRSRGFGKPGRYGLLSVSDTGIGMDESTRRRIFEPFFTTKGQGMGTGLGLSMVYGIVKQHGGYIDVRSELGKGSTFDIYLPLVKIGERKAETGVGEARLEGGSETVLVAEDDAAVRSIMRDVLERFGYKVYEAADGAQAVRAFERHKDEIELLVLDVVMPGLGGKEAYDRIREMRPDVKALFTSGQVSEMINRDVVGRGLEFLPKPASPRQLIRKVREVLDRKT
jgi:two-component system cell cycle sensor histidine kinase/response regulator CckA